MTGLRAKMTSWYEFLRKKYSFEPVCGFWIFLEVAREKYVPYSIMGTNYSPAQTMAIVRAMRSAGLIHCLFISRVRWPECFPKKYLFNVYLVWPEFANSDWIP
jgi:hypothetical protein